MQQGGLDNKHFEMLEIFIMFWCKMSGYAVLGQTFFHTQVVFIVPLPEWSCLLNVKFSARPHKKLTPKTFLAVHHMGIGLTLVLIAMMGTHNR